MIIIINGFLGVGKTTVSSRLNSALDYSVMLDGDYLGHVNPFQIYSKDRVDHLYSTLAINVAHHQRYGYRHFIINYVFESEDSLKDLMQRLQPLDPDVFAFRLSASKDETMRRIYERRSEYVGSEISRSLELIEIMEPLGNSIGERIEVTKLSADETTTLILHKVEGYREPRFGTIDFNSRYMDWVNSGKKKATTRLVKAGETAKFQAEDYCLATNEEMQLGFAVLRIERVEERTYASIDTELAYAENFSTAAELKAELKLYYPAIGDNDLIRVYYFDCLHMVEIKLG